GDGQIPAHAGRPCRSKSFSKSSARTEDSQKEGLRLQAQGVLACRDRSPVGCSGLNATFKGVTLRAGACVQRSRARSVPTGGCSVSAPGWRFASRLVLQPASRTANRQKNPDYARRLQRVLRDLNFPSEYVDTVTSC